MISEIILSKKNQRDIFGNAWMNFFMEFDLYVDTVSISLVQVLYIDLRPVRAVKIGNPPM